MEIPGYSLHRPLGRGGMAVVYLATQDSLNREVALKILSPSTDPTAGERFLREARIAASLHHPNIVPIHDFGVHEGQAYLAMEYLAGGSVAPVSGERLAPDAALRIIRDIAGALDYAHERGVVHRDIKPDNILRGERGGAVLSDFGIARLIQGESLLTSEGCSVGTPHYMSPEQLRGEKLDGRSDLYSLGVVLWQLVTGDLPYSGSDSWAIGTQHLGAEIPRLPSGLSSLQGLVDALMAKQADARPASGGDVVRRIDALLAERAAAAQSGAPANAAHISGVANATTMGGAANAANAAASSATAVTPSATVAPRADRRRATPASTPTRGWPAWALPVGVLTVAIAIGAIWLGTRTREAAQNADASSTASTSTATAANSPAAGANPATSANALSLAVMPFDDLSEKQDQSYFSDGIAEELSNRLSQVKGLSVAGRASAQSLKGKSASIADIGRSLSVNRVLQGSVRRNGDKLRVTVQLSNVSDGFQLWSQTFDREMTDVFAVQDEIAGAVVDTLKLKLLGPARRHTPSVEVYDLYLRGRQSLIRANRHDITRALESFRQAVTLDPAYAEAFAMLAMAEIFIAPRDPKGRAEAKQRAMAAAERAVALDPQLGDAYGSRGFLRRLEWDWAGALSDAERSVMLGPMDGRNHLRHGLALQSVGRLREGLRAFERAAELEPLLTPAWHQLGVGRGAVGDFAGMRQAYRRVSAIDPEFLDSAVEAELLLLEGHAAKARALYAANEHGALGVIMADHSLGKRAEALQALNRFADAHSDIDPLVIAEAYAWLGAKSQAFQWLDRALVQRTSSIAYLHQDPLLHSLHDDPRFAAFTKKLGMPPAP